MCKCMSGRVCDVVPVSTCVSVWMPVLVFKFIVYFPVKTWTPRTSQVTVFDPVWLLREDSFHAGKDTVLTDV